MLCAALEEEIYIKKIIIWNCNAVNNWAGENNNNNVAK